MTFDGNNKQPSVFSAGPNKTYDGLFGGDDLAGYRLRREGARGD